MLKKQVLKNLNFTDEDIKKLKETANMEELEIKKDVIITKKYDNGNIEKEKKTVKRNRREAQRILRALNIKWN